MLRLNRINPKSILSEHISHLDESAPSYPKKEGDEWWLLWEGDEPVAYFVCGTWELNLGYGVCHSVATPDLWAFVWEELAKYAEEQGHPVLFALCPSGTPLPHLTLKQQNFQVHEMLLNPAIKEQTDADVPVHLSELQLFR